MIFRALGVRLLERPTPGPVVSELPDLTTFTSRGSGGIPWEALAVAPPEKFWTPLSRPVPGTQVEGFLPSDGRARFVLRIPSKWNGRLVVAASPGLLGEKACDLYWNDFLMARGCAFACTDKGLRLAADGDTFYVPIAPESGIRRWPARLEELIRTCVEHVRLATRRGPERTYAVGISNGGYLVRKLLEDAPGMADGGVEVSGVFWPAEGGGLLDQIPKALAATAAREPDRPALEAAGFPAHPEWDAVLHSYRAAYWLTTLAVFTADLDPGFDGDLARYDLSSRPQQVRDAVRSIANSGAITKPLLSLAGGRDVLVTASRHAEAYRDLVAANGKGGLHELTIVPDATHADADAAVFPEVTPLMPEAHRAFDRLLGRVEGKQS